MTRAVTVAESFNSTVAVGTIIPASSSTVPTGYLACNGGEYAIANYGDLHSVIGTTWGSLTDGSGGSGSTHFVVPDLRGEFLRGWANGSSNDPDAASRTGGDAVGSFQDHAVGDHQHPVPMSPGQGASTYASYYIGNNSYGTIYNFQSSNPNVGNSSTENRPRNKYVQYCIKY